MIDILDGADFDVFIFLYYLVNCQNVNKKIYKKNLQCQFFTLL